MTAVSGTIRCKIRENGPIGFDAFMEAALYDPGGGYYAMGAPVTGREGDFFTSVSVGEVFGRLLAESYFEIWNALGSPGEFTVVEQGVADGQLAEDVLGAIEKRDAEMAEATRCILVEPIPGLREIQEEKLAEKWGPKVSWATGLAEVCDVEGVFFSNECLDAFPFRRIRFENGAWRELCVALGEDGGFCWESAEVDGAELEAESKLLAGDFPEGYTTEIRPAIPDWARALGGVLRRGLALIVDYGYSENDFFDESRKEGTMRCFRGHRAFDDPLIEVGERDITAHVNFTRAIRSALSNGFELEGFTDQHHFLVGAGEEILRGMEGRPDPKFVRQFQTLAHPGIMGMAFKVLGLSRGLAPETRPLKGFGHCEPGKGSRGIN